MGHFVFYVCLTATIVGAGCAKPSPRAAGGSTNPAVVASAAPAGDGRPASAAAPASVVAAPAVARAPEAEVELVGKGGASGAGNGMAVVIVMLPATGESPGSAHPHKYRLSLTADTENATVEVDGQPMGAARIQHVYPQMKPERASARTSPVAAPVAVPVAVPVLAPSPGLPLAGLRGIEDVHVRPPRVRATPITTRPFGVSSPDIALTSNGAPIID